MGFTSMTDSPPEGFRELRRNKEVMLSVSGA